MTDLVCLNEKYVPAHPSGIPADGRLRYGMTPEQASLYRWLVANRSHDEEFHFDFRRAAEALGFYHGGAVYQVVRGLIERGWLYRVENGNHLDTVYGFVQPIMRFREPRS